MPVSSAPDGLPFDLMHILLCAALIALAIALLMMRQASALKAQRLMLDLDHAKGDLAEAEAREAALTAAHAREESRAHAAELQLADLRARAEGDGDRFTSLAQSVLAQANQQFIRLANETFEKHQGAATGQLTELVAPLKQNMDAFAQKVEAIEKVRAEDKTLLQEQVKSLGDNLLRNTAETGKLVNALTAPKGGGRWGEMSLRNVLEQAGLKRGVDFVEQVMQSGEDGRLRPDCIINLPGGREIVVDAKVTVESYLAACNEADPALSAQHFKAYAAGVERQCKLLSSKDYQGSLGDRFDFVIMYVPGENFYAAALEHAPGLLELAMTKRVIIASPTTLVMLAKSVGLAWREHHRNQNVVEAATLAAEVYRRFAVLLGHVETLGKSLDKSVGAFNSLVGSAESKVLPALRRFDDLSLAPPDKSLPELARIEQSVRTGPAAAQPQLELGDSAGRKDGRKPS